MVIGFHNFYRHIEINYKIITVVRTRIHNHIIYSLIQLDLIIFIGIFLPIYEAVIANPE